MATTKDSRIAVRLSSDQSALIRHAAETEGTSITEFTVAATIKHAVEVLADRRVFMLGDTSWHDFVTMLERPVVHKPRLNTVLSRPSVFSEE